MITTYEKFLEAWQRRLLTEADDLTEGDPDDEGEDIDPEEFDDFDDAEEEDSDKEDSEKEDEEDEEPQLRDKVEPEKAPVFVDNRMSLLSDNMREFADKLRNDMEDVGNDFMLHEIDFDNRTPGNAYTTVKATLDGKHVSMEILAPIGSVAADANNPNRLTDVFVTIQVYTDDYEILGKMVDNRMPINKLDAKYLQDSVRKIIKKKKG